MSQRGRDPSGFRRSVAAAASPELVALVLTIGLAVLIWAITR